MLNILAEPTRPTPPSSVTMQRLDEPTMDGSKTTKHRGSELSESTKKNHQAGRDGGQLHCLSA
jgi:hypothetical protein